MAKSETVRSEATLKLHAGDAGFHFDKEILLVDPPHCAHSLHIDGDYRSMLPRSRSEGACHACAAPARDKGNATR